MGLSTAAVIAARLMQAGRAASTPVLLVENASRPQERRALCSLAGLGEAAQGFGGPAILVIGEVAALAQVDRTDEPARPDAARLASGRLA